MKTTPSRTAPKGADGKIPHVTTFSETSSLKSETASVFANAINGHRCIHGSLRMPFIPKVHMSASVRNPAGAIGLEDTATGARSAVHPMVCAAAFAVYPVPLAAFGGGSAQCSTTQAKWNTTVTTKPPLRRICAKTSVPLSLSLLSWIRTSPLKQGGGTAMELPRSLPTTVLTRIKVDFFCCS